MVPLQATRVGAKPDPQPTTSQDSAQTAQTAQQHPDFASPFAAAAGSSNPATTAWPQGCSSSGSRLEAVASIKEALAPLCPAQLAMVQEQLRQSRLARQQEAWGGVEPFGAPMPAAAPGPCISRPAGVATPPCTAGAAAAGQDGERGVNPLVQQVAAALAHGKVSAQDVSRVLSSLDPAVFLPPPQQQHQQHQLPQQYSWAPQTQHQHQHQQHHWPQQHQQLPHRQGICGAAAVAPQPSSSGLAMPAAIPMPPSPFCSSSSPAALPSVLVRRVSARTRTRCSVTAPYSAVLTSLQLPPAALEAHPAAASAGDAAAQHHPGSSSRKGRRSCRRARGQVGSLLRSVSTGSDAAGATSLAGTAEVTQPHRHTAPCAFQQAAGDLLHISMAAQQPAAVDSPVVGPQPDPLSTAAPEAMLLCTEAAWGRDPAGAHDTDKDHAAATAAAGTPSPAQGTSLAARFARLPPHVQDDILRQLDELSALEEEGRAAQEQTGPRRSGRARKVRNLDETVQSLAARGSVRSQSPTPPPADEATPAPAHKRMRLDAAASSPALQHGSPAAGSSGHAQQEAGEAPPALDLWVCPEPAEPMEQEQLPRRRRIPRKVGPRAAARKRMHRRTFRRGKPQRAPIA